MFKNFFGSRKAIVAINRYCIFGRHGFIRYFHPWYLLLENSIKSYTRLLFTLLESFCALNQSKIVLKNTLLLFFKLVILIVFHCNSFLIFGDFIIICYMHTHHKYKASCNMNLSIKTLSNVTNDYTVLGKLCEHEKICINHSRNDEFTVEGVTGTDWDKGLCLRLFLFLAMKWTSTN